MTTSQNMTDTATPISTEDAAAARATLLKDIGAKWGKFSQAEVADLKTKEQLVTMVAAQYGLDRGAASRDIDAVLKGRAI